MLPNMSEPCTQSVAQEGEADDRAAPPLQKPQRGRRAPALRGGNLIDLDAATTTTNDIHGSGDGLHLLPRARIVHRKVVPIGTARPGRRIGPV
jgi:hypothetical protein